MMSCSRFIKVHNFQWLPYNRNKLRKFRHFCFDDGTLATRGPFSFLIYFLADLNPLSDSSTKWSNTLKQFVGNLPTNCLSVFDHFVKLALKGLNLLLVVKAILDPFHKSRCWQVKSDIVCPFSSFQNSGLQRRIGHHMEHLWWRIFPEIVYGLKYS